MSGFSLSQADAEASKRWSHRVCPPQETLTRLKPHLATMGITRLSDVTGLDRLGIPVAQAVRPMGLSLSVSQGKGMTLPAALASAMMESVEGWHAEHVTLPQRKASPREMAGGFDLDAAALRKSLSQEVLLPWVPGRDLVSGEEIWVPFDLVTKDFTQPATCPEFMRSTNGLAGGNTYAEAVASALHEVIERDCLAEHQSHSPADLRRRLRHPDWVRALGPDVAWLSDRIEGAGLRLYLWELTTEIGVPCFRAQLLETVAHGSQPCRIPSYGAGCHLDPATAAVRAITEAAQSRLTDIAGSRDDLTAARYRPAVAGNVVSVIETEMDLERLPPMAPPLNRAGFSADEDVTTLCASLAGQGFEQAVIVDLSRTDLPVHVVRALVPGLGFPLGHGFARGRRLREGAV